MNRFLVVDVETTGNHPREGDRIIQVGAVAVDDGRIVETFSTFVNPGIPIPPFISSLTGITDEMVADAPDLEDVLPRLLRLMDGRAFVAHNAFFDLQFVQEALLSQGYYTFDGYVVDTVELARLLLPTQGGYRLVDLAQEFDIPLDHPHRADCDAMATAQVLLRLLDLLNELPLVTIQRLEQLVSSFRSDIGALLRHVEAEKLVSLSFPDDSPDAGAPGGDRWDIYRQLALKARRFPAAKHGDAPPAELDRVIEDVLGEGGALANLYPGYQRREAQAAMVRAIYDGMRDGAHLLVEAGTGTGKSIGYLLPSILWAREQGEQVVISTHTIHLQEQLFQRDIPLLQEALPFAFSAALLKGRGNYLCLRKLERSLEEGTEQESLELKLAKAQLVTWLTQTETGDVEELSLPPVGRLFWQQVKSDANSCLHRNCPWFSRCYYFQARERARRADVVIVNHALLVGDLAAPAGVLPPYHVAVIDEAHQLEEVAGQHLGIQVSTAEIMSLIERLEPTGRSTLVSDFANEVEAWNPLLQAEIEDAVSDLADAYDEARDQCQRWSDALYQWASRRAKDSADSGSLSVRFALSDLSGRHKRVLTYTERVKTALLSLAREAERLSGLAARGEAQPPFRIRSLLTDVRGVADDLHKAAQALHALLAEERDDLVRWLELETRTSRKHVFLYAAPLHVSETLAEQWLAQKRSVTFTSATLTVKQSFAHAVESLGLDRLPPERVRTLALPSPFDYEQQGLILIPSDFPAPGSDSEDAFLEAVIQGCADVAEAAEGRTLILFTSHQMLRHVYDGLKQRLPEDEYVLLGHGIDSSNRSKLVRRFRQERRAVLLGTSSFWEGVDIPGDDLSCVVIVKLPFLPPNQPLLEGRSERMKAEKKNPFQSLHLPRAVIRLKQGLGRLIRHHEDRGVVVIFDTRIVEARYGRAFLQSLPPYRVETGAWPELRRVIRPFLSGMPPHDAS